MLPRVAIIYLSYNSTPYLEDVVRAWEELSYPKECLDIIIVDNASQDGSQEWIRAQVLPKSEKELPRVTFFPSGENIGFAAGNNLGMQHAMLDGAAYVFVHNADLRLHPDAITEAVVLAESDPNIGAVQSEVCLWQDENRLNTSGGMIHFLGFGFARDNGRLRSEAHLLDGEEIAFASGAASLYRASALRLSGLFDDFLFLYHEDLDLSWRLRLVGYRVVLSTKSLAYHKYIFQKSIQKFYWMERNRLLVHATNLSLGTLILLFPIWLVNECAMVVFGIKGGWIREKVLSWVDVLRPRTWAYVRVKRKEIARMRRVSDREIVRLFTGKIEHQETRNAAVERFANPVLSALWKLLRLVIVC